MREIQQQLIQYLKNIDIEGCVTGSALLDEYYEGSDVDFFCYSEKAFIKLFYQLYHSKEFCMVDKIEIWKADQLMHNNKSKDFKFGVQTLKFLYNATIPLNIVRKHDCNSAYDVISSFDMSIICKAYDVKIKKYLDLTEETAKTKVATFNSWNPAYSSTEPWQISRILRQLDRVIKYHKRGYNTDAVAQKYLELINKIQETESIFTSESYNETLEITKTNTLIVKKIIEIWLSTHNITEEETQLLQTTLKKLTN